MRHLLSIGDLDRPAIEALLDPTAYTGLCADMAREGAARARSVADAMRQEGSGRQDPK